MQGKNRQNRQKQRGVENTKEIARLASLTEAFDKDEGVVFVGKAQETLAPAKAGGAGVPRPGNAAARRPERPIRGS
jgi:hypothetical protein